MSNIISYRQNAITEQPKDTRPEFGLIRAPKPTPPHKCNPPSFWKRMWYRIKRQTIHEGSMWRCNCGMIFLFEVAEWRRQTGTWGKGMWRNKGGKISEKDNED